MERISGTTSWRTLEITSEPYLVMTRTGYAGAVKAIDLPGKNEGELLVSGIQSLAKAVEPLRVANGGRFVGIRFRFKIEKGLFSSRYRVDQEGLKGLNGTPEEVQPTVTQGTSEKGQGEKVNTNVTVTITKVLASPESGLFWCPRCHKGGRLLKPRETRLECLGCHLEFFVAEVSKAEEVHQEAVARAQTEYERGKADHSRVQQTLCEEQPQSVASRAKGRESQSNEDKLWQHILRQYDNESADFRAKEWNDETGLIPQNESSLYSSIEETPLLLEAEPRDEETSEVTNRGRIKSPNAHGENFEANPDVAVGSAENYSIHRDPAFQQPGEGIPISRTEFSEGFLRYLNNTQQDISRGLLSGEKPISLVFVNHLLASGFRTEQISRMTCQEAFEFLETTVPGQVPRLFSQNGSNPSNISTNESVQVDPTPDQGQVATITSDEARRRLIELRDTRLKRSYGDLAPEQGLLRRAMISAFLAYRPRTHEEFIARIPQSERLNTDNRQIDAFLEEVFSIVGLIEGE